MKLYEDLEQLRRDASELRDGPAKVKLLERAVQIADEIGVEEVQYNTRMQLVSAGTFGCGEDRALAAFTWCLSRFDSNPTKYRPRRILWKFKWILSSLTDYASISRETIKSVQDEFEQRLREHDYSLSPLYRLKHVAARDLGDRDEARHWFHKWQAGPKDSLQDCDACEASGLFDALAYFGDDENALRAAAPILDGRLTCNSIPSTFYNDVLAPLARLKRLEEAEHYATIGYAFNKASPWHVEDAADYLLFWIHRQNTVKALEVFERHLMYVNEEPTDEGRLAFQLASWILMLHLLNQPAARAPKISCDIPGATESGDYNNRELARYFERATRKIVTDFDARNGNSSVSEWLQESAAFCGVTIS